MMNSELISQVLHIWCYFITYAFGGWIAQGFYVGAKDRKFVNTGFFHGPIVPIYGFGALLVIYVVDRMSMNPILIFINSFWITSVLEYVTSWYMQKRYHRLWWDYSKRFMNINGRVCLLNSTLYGIGGLFITFCSQPIVKDVADALPYWGLIAFDGITLGAFLYDFITTTMEMNRHRQALEQLHAHIQAAIKAKAEKQQALVDKHVAEARQNLAQMQAHSRHLHGMVHQRLEAHYQQSIDTLHKAQSDLKEKQEAIKAKLQ